MAKSGANLWTGRKLPFAGVALLAGAALLALRGGAEADAFSDWPLAAEYRVQVATGGTDIEETHAFSGSGWDNWSNEVLDSTDRGGEPAGFVRTHRPDGVTEVYDPRTEDAFVESEAEPGSLLAPGPLFNLPHLWRLVDGSQDEDDPSGDIRRRVERTLPGLDTESIRAWAGSHAHLCEDAPFPVDCAPGEPVEIAYELAWHQGAEIPLWFVATTSDGDVIAELEVLSLRGDVE